MLIVDGTPEERCDEEPIRLPGAVQQHGFFLLTDERFERVVAASENVERFLGKPVKLVLGARTEDILQREMLAAVRDLRGCRAPDSDGVAYLGSFQLQGELFSLLSHCVDGYRALEFELQERLVGPEMMNAVITNFVSSLSRVSDEPALFEALTLQLADLTGYDRVLLYSFNDAGDGTVLSEVNNGRLPSYSGLRFPADDIPQQARELYLLNTVRLIPDASYTPSPLSSQGELRGAPIDLSLSTLRSVSPVHLEYMRNMGTAASMSVSIVVEGRLWGLISAHNVEPKVVPYLVRSACDMLTKMAATQLTSLITAQRLRQMVNFGNVQRSLVTALAAEPNYLDALVHQVNALPALTGAAGVALWLDGQLTSAGDVPSGEALYQLTQWLMSHPDLEVFASSHFSLEFPWAEIMRSKASGVIAVRISAVLPRFLLWFRPEIVETVHWAGEPAKIEDHEHRLHPRASFAEWKEISHGHSEPWTPLEVDAARDFRSALTIIGLRRAEEAVELSEARFQRLTQALPIKIFTCDDEGRLLYVNERWEHKGLHPRGRWFEEASLDPGDALMCANRWREAVASEGSFEAEVRLQASADTTERWNVVRAAPFQRAGASRAGWIGTFIDLTESKEREMALRMSEKLALTGRMTSVIAHEINNPLEAITNLMYLLRTELPEEGPAGSYIGMVESELERISGITKQTLRWNRESSDQRERFSVSSMIDDVLRLFAGKIRNRQIVVRVQGDRAVLVQAVLGQLRQVLANLVSNAVDAAPVGGQVTVCILCTPSETGFSVADNGRGMESQLQARMFEPFYSTKGDLGNGLGLYISREIVDRHKGRIEVESAPGKGTRMSVLLPV